MIARLTKDRGERANKAFETIRQKFEMLRGVLDERAQRWWAGSEALAHGRGGVTVVHEATGMSRSTIRVGIRELAREDGDEALPHGRLRKPGGGRKRLTEKQPGLPAALEKLVDPATRGDPMSPLRWTSKSVVKLAAALQAQGFKVGPDSVAALLKDMNYSLQANRKTLEGTAHPDRDAQFQYIADRSAEFMAAGQPVISVDSKKKELVGAFHNKGREYQPKGSPERVKTHDFKDPELGKVIPHGVYDPAANVGWVSVGIDHDTAEFAAESLRRWWKTMGSQAYPKAQRLLITADCGGSNGYRTRAWKLGLQSLADELGLETTVCHFPPGTSKWNKIEHRLFCHITQNWRGRPLVSHEVVVDLISNTTTTKGLRVQAALDTGRYPTAVKVTEEQMATVQVCPAEFHGEWNYTVKPRLAPAQPAPVSNEENLVG
ncbi:MAG: ISAzo13 family transposase [Nitrospiraceae bacterium]